MRLPRRVVATLALLAAPATGSRLAARSTAPVDTALHSALRWRLVGPFRGGRSVTVAGVRTQPGV
jgi:hypothetical protein